MVVNVIMTFRLCKPMMKETIRLWWRRWFDTASTGRYHTIKKNGNKSGFFNNIEECHAVGYTFFLQTTSPVVFKLIGIEGHLLWPVVKIPNIVQNVLWAKSVLHFEEITMQVLGFLCTSIIVQHRKTMHSNYYSSNKIKSNENDREK